MKRRNSKPGIMFSGETMDIGTNNESTSFGPSDTWRAWHVFLGDTATQEKFLVDVVLAELVSLQASVNQVSAFFLRYWENGPHIRLRLKGIDDARFRAVGERFRREAQILAAGAPVQPSTFGPEMRFDGRPPDPEALAFFPQGTTAEVAYEPEIRRYGGRSCLALNESLFAASSSIALRVIKATQNRWALRQRIALNFTAAAITTAVENKAEFVTFTNHMAAVWRGFWPDVEAAESQAERMLPEIGRSVRSFAVSALDGGSTHFDPATRQWVGAIDQYIREVRRLAERGLLVSPITESIPADEASTKAALLSMLLSQIHMMNNRLGIAPNAEYIIARVLNMSIERQGDD